MAGMDNGYPLVIAEDLRARWPDMPLGSDATAQVLLEDAGALIRASAPHWAELDEYVLRMVACAMVKRGMAASAYPTAPPAFPQTAGPYNQQVASATPAGSLPDQSREEAPKGGALRKHSSMTCSMRKWCANVLAHHPAQYAICLWSTRRTAGH